MTFNGQYLTYEEYLELDGSLDEAPFNLLEFEARKIIDKRTQGRLVGKTIPQEVKLCIFKLIPILKSYTEYDSKNKGISSENTDGYSVTYASATTNVTLTKNNEINDVIKTYLLETKIDDIPVLYRGINGN